ncbi:MAG: hypothetical protein BWY86_00634 [Candidatus Aminicenantes bacterium ADurb.Bin508]|nr:MAG: hypothetical protein BWY86_00634 [Candidatus Aminicenantes bacterium ADurb.Bin508]
MTPLLSAIASLSDERSFSWTKERILSESGQRRRETTKEAMFTKEALMSVSFSWALISGKASVRLVSRTG